MDQDNGDRFVPPHIRNNQQSFNPYGSYASSNTYYDPAFTPPSKQSSLGHGTRKDPFSQHQFESPYSATSHNALDPRSAPAGDYNAKSSYAPGGYASGRPGDRSPSPTPSELEDLNRGVIDWKTVLNWRTYAKRKYITWIIVFIVIIVLVALMTIYHSQIVQWLTPVATWMKGFSLGWLIPIAVLFVISFPPLFGHEIVAVLVGLVWGLWVGFGIVAAGTLLGEIGNFYAFKYLCSARGEKLEKQKLSYACLARVVREGGFKIALIARLSAIPGHFTTAVFATCGMGFFVFTLAALLSMPKQLITVYLGVILEQSSETAAQQAADKNSRIISDVVLGVTLLITLAAAWYILKEMNRVRPAVLKERRAAKKKLAALSTDTAYLSGPSNMDVSSEESSMTPVKYNEQRMGAYGYGGYGSAASYSTDSVAAPIPRSNAGVNEEWAMSERRAEGYPPPQQQHYGHRPGEGEKVGREQYRPSPLNSQQQGPPHIDHVPNLTGSRRLDRETWETSDGTTVGMGSWGGILKEGSDASQYQQPHQQQSSWDEHSLATPRAGAYRTQQIQAYAPQHHSKPDEYGVGGGLSALGAPMGGGDTVMVTPKSVGGARQSREMPGHVAGRSMRAVVEGYGTSADTEEESGLAYMASSSPPAPAVVGAAVGRRGYALTDPGSQQPSVSSADSGGGGYGYHQQTAAREASAAGTFGDGRSFHSREFATAGTTDEIVPPPGMNRR